MFSQRRARPVVEVLSRGNRQSNRVFFVISNPASIAGYMTSAEYPGNFDAAGPHGGG